MNRFWFVRNTHAANLLENFLIAAVAAILVIRLALQLTGFPQLGGGGLHIAHMLWGGLGMLAALFIMLEFVNYSARAWAAVIGGIGFGAFIDELGKFITSDNDYFYQPAVAAIYVIFVVLFLATRRLNRPRLLSSEESLINASEIVREGMLAGGLEERDQQTAYELLGRSNPEEPLTQALRGVLDTTRKLPHRHPNWLVRARHSGAAFYAKLVSKKWFKWIVICIFIGIAVADLGWIALALAVDPDGVPVSFSEWVDLIAAAVTGVLILVGVVTMRRSRLKTYQWFRRGMLVSILITQVFTFYQYQFVALGNLTISLLLLVALRYMINQEEARSVPLT